MGAPFCITITPYVVQLLQNGADLAGPLERVVGRIWVIVLAAARDAAVDAEGDRDEQAADRLY